MATQRHYLEISTDYPPESRFGTGEHVSSLAAALATAGHRVTVVTPPRLSGDRTPDVSVEGVHVIRSQQPVDRQPRGEGDVSFSAETYLQERLAFDKEMFDRLSMMAADVDVIHNHSNGTVPLACELRRLWNVPLMSTVHMLDGALERSRTRRTPWIFSHVLRGLEAEGLRRSDAIISHSSTIAAWVGADFPLCAERIHILDHPVDRMGVTRVSYAEHDPFRLLFVGRLVPDKGILQLIEAVCRAGTKEIECWVAGTGPMLPELKAAAERAGVAVQWLGKVARAAVLKLYHEVDALAIPSLSAAYGLALQEGMAAGVPVIASNIPVFRERLVHEVDGLLVPTVSANGYARPDVDSLSAAISRMVGSRELRAQLGRSAQDRASGQSFERYVLQIDALLTGLSEQ